MTYSDLLHRIPFEEIVSHMTFLRYNRDALVKEFSELHDRLLAVEPRKSDNHMMIVDRWEGTSPDIDMVCTVRDKNDSNWCVLEDISMSTSYLAWNRNRDVELSEQELLAGLSWELSKSHLYDSAKKHIAILKAWGIEYLSYSNKTE